MIAGLPPDGGSDFNRLVFEKSPYLLQHARNPVDWYPWGDEAFERAKREDKPVFLSIGYSTCHWCHVMERESFEDDEVAALLNAHFVAIKVDREERPDVDQIYMSVTQAMTGSGGWPMTVVMTPDRRPFFAGTYFPKSGRLGRQGMMELLPALSDAWKGQRAQVLASAEQVQDFLQRTAQSPTASSDLDASVLDAAFAALESAYDPVHGGFGGAPKFPVPHNLRLLLRHWRRTGDPRALDMVVHTLERMRLGGIWDHVGFGFHRYSTDAEWLLPHFEKMLYDQALLTLAYVEAWQVTQRDDFRRTADEMLAYVRRDLTAPQGGFLSAEDADSEGEEGLFYLWTPSQLADVLGEDDARLAVEIFGVKAEGNFLEQSTGERTGSSILHMGAPLEDPGSALGFEQAAVAAHIDSMRRRLFEAREARIHPHKDDKVLTDWNGLMIAAMAKAGRAFADETLVSAASWAADFALESLRTQDGRLVKRWRSGEAALPPVLDDYAFLVWGLIELYQATFDVDYLAAAVQLTETMLADFWGGEETGFYLATAGRDDLLVRPRELYDGAIPAGYSIATLDLLLLARLTGEARYEELASQALQAAAGTAARAPQAHTQLLIALDFVVGPAHEVVVAGAPQADDTRAMLNELARSFLPNVVVHLRPPGDQPVLGGLAPFLVSFEPPTEEAMAYVCEQFACKAPTPDVAVMLASVLNEPQGAPQK